MYVMPSGKGLGRPSLKGTNLVPGAAISKQAATMTIGEGFVLPCAISSKASGGCLFKGPVVPPPSLKLYLRKGVAELGMSGGVYLFGSSFEGGLFSFSQSRLGLAQAR